LPAMTNTNYSSAAESVKYMARKGPKLP
jgi:hypothetical protein